MTSMIIRTPMEFLDLGIIDWSRDLVSWSSRSEAIDTIMSWVSGGFVAERLEFGYYDTSVKACVPWPGWSHVGDHAGVGRRLWNVFMSNARAGDYLEFSDSPDFFGKAGGAKFFGDIGQCSVMAFLTSIKSMRKGDFWLSVQDDGNTHIVLTARYDVLATRQLQNKRDWGLAEVVA